MMGGPVDQAGTQVGFQLAQRAAQVSGVLFVGKTQRSHGVAQFEQPASAQFRRLPGKLGEHFGDLDDDALADAASDPSKTDAWFVAFAPASAPRVAVAVMLIGAGQGGASAAPIAREVLAAAL